MNNFHILFCKDNTHDYLYQVIWRTPSQSELNQIMFDMELTHFGSEA